MSKSIYLDRYYIVKLKGFIFELKRDEADQQNKKSFRNVNCMIFEFFNNIIIKNSYHKPDCYGRKDIFCP